MLTKVPALRFYSLDKYIGGGRPGRIGFENHGRVHIAARKEIADHHRPPGGKRCQHGMVQMRGDRFVKRADHAEGVAIQFPGFQLDTASVGKIVQMNRGEIRIAGFWAYAGKFRIYDSNDAPGASGGLVRAVECLERGQNAAFERLGKENTAVGKHTVLVVAGYSRYL